MKQIAVGIALWVVLFVVLAPDSIRDGDGFYLSLQSFGFAVGLAVLVYAAVRIVARILGAK